MNTFSMAHFDDSKAAEQFMNTGYTILDVHSEVQIDIAEKLFTELGLFFQQDRKYLERWTFDLGLLSKPDTGPIFRKDEENKNFFHAHRILRHLLYLRGVNINIFGDLLTFFETINTYAHKRLLHFLKELIPLINNQAPSKISLEQFQNEESLALSVSRALMYAYAESTGTEIAEKHEDQSGLTLHFFQSHTGLFLNDQTNLYEQTPGKALVFPGKKFQLLTGGEQYYDESKTAFIPKAKNGLIQALPHGVISIPSAEQYIRKALVYFMHPSGVTLMPKIKK